MGHVQKVVFTMVWVDMGRKLHSSYKLYGKVSIYKPSLSLPVSISYSVNKILELVRVSLIPKLALPGTSHTKPIP